MSKLKLFGIPGSRALRSIWAVEEVYTRFEQVTRWARAAYARPALARARSKE